MDTPAPLTHAAQNSPHKIISILFAGGWSDKKVRDHLVSLGHRISVQAVRGLRESPLMQIAVRETEKDLQERLLTDVSDIRQHLQAEALPSVRVLTEVRDGHHDADAGQRRGAANDLLSYAVPKVTVSDSQKRHIIEFSPETVQAMAAVMREAGHEVPALPPSSVIDVTPEVVGDDNLRTNGDIGSAGPLSPAPIEGAGWPPGADITGGGPGPPPGSVIPPDFYNRDRDFDSN